MPEIIESQKTEETGENRSMTTITIPHNYVPRLYQENLYNSLADGYKRGVAVWHRRAGKDKTLVNIVAKEAFKRVGSYYYFFPTYTQGKKILWDGMDRDGFPFLGHFPEEVRVGKPNSTEMKLRLVNGSLFQVVGSDNINSIVGTNPVGCVFSEYALQDPTGWDYISPILLENGGWALFNFTPRGYNHGHRLYEMARGNPDWFCELLTIDDTRRRDGSPVVSHDQIDRERASGKTEDFLQQEYWCSFEASIPGAYFANEMRMARARICKVSVDANLPVSTFWDLGSGKEDAMTMWLCQDVGRSVHVVAVHGEYGKPFLYFVNWLKKWNAYEVEFDEHVLPHDGASPNPQTAKSSVDFLQQLLKDHGVSGKVKTAKRPSKKADGIEACRQMIHRCYFDEESCGVGIEALRQYHKEFDMKTGTYKHVHDWTSHYVDGFQTMALAHKFKTSDVIFRPDRTKTGVKSWRPRRLRSMRV